MNQKAISSLLGILTHFYVDKYVMREKTEENFIHAKRLMIAALLDTKSEWFVKPEDYQDYSDCVELTMTLVHTQYENAVDIGSMLAKLHMKYNKNLINNASTKSAAKIAIIKAIFEGKVTSQPLIMAYMAQSDVTFDGDFVNTCINTLTITDENDRRNRCKDIIRKIIDDAGIDISVEGVLAL